MSDQYLHIGYFSSTHGYKGNVKLKSVLDNALPIEDLEVVFVESAGRYVPYFVEQIRLQKKDILIVKLEDVETEEDAKALKSQSVYAREQDLPEQEPEHEWLGFNLVEVSNQLTIGSIEDIVDISGNEMAIVQFRDEEVMIPLNDDFIQSVDEGQKIISVNLPEGLLDLNQA